MIERTAKTGKNLQIPTQKMPAVFFARDPDNRQQTTDNRQQTTDNRQQTTDNRQLYTSFK
jgi:hypothetical protein